MEVSKGGFWHPSAHVEVAYFTVNHSLLMGSTVETVNSTKSALLPDMHVAVPAGALAS